MDLEEAELELTISFAASFTAKFVTQRWSRKPFAVMIANFVVGFQVQVLPKAIPCWLKFETFVVLGKLLHRVD